MLSPLTAGCGPDRPLRAPCGALASWHPGCGAKVSEALALEAAEAGRQHAPARWALSPQGFFPFLCLSFLGAVSRDSPEDWPAAPSFSEVMLVFFKIYIY